MVSERSRRPSTPASIATSRGRSRRTSGSPPVSRTSPTPMEASSATSRAISSKRRISSRSSQGSPSAGMQYWQRKLQRSVTEMRTSPIRRPWPSRSGSRRIVCPTRHRLPRPLDHDPGGHGGEGHDAEGQRRAEVRRAEQLGDAASPPPAPRPSGAARASPHPRLGLQRGQQRRHVGPRVLALQRPQPRARRPPSARRPRSPCSATKSASAPARRAASRRCREVEPLAVGVQRGDQLVDAPRRRDRGDGDHRHVAPAQASAARR